MTDADVVVIGAGAAGVGATRRLIEAGRTPLVLEASDRVGGRAWTLNARGMALDLGCGWLHSADRNPWVAIAEAAGFAIDRRASSWGRQYRDLGFSPADRAEAGAAFDDFNDRLRTAPPPSDRAADVVPADSRWENYIEALSGYINGTGLRALSVEDYLAYDDAASEVNWRVPAGYGSLVAATLPVVPLHLSTPVREVHTGSGRIRLATDRGDITADAVIVTVSTAVLAGDGIRWSPDLDDHRHAAAQLPLGLANKLFLTLDDDTIAADSHLLGNPHRSVTGSYYLRPFGRPVVEAFFGGDGAEELEVDGLDAAAAFAIDELALLLGSGVRGSLRLIAGSAWRGADHVKGSYSHALPGCHGARAKLREPFQNRVFFAGEACSASDFSTAHGAFDSGVEAAEMLLRSC